MERFIKKFATEIIEESVYKDKLLHEVITEIVDLIYQYAKKHYLKVENIIYVPRGMKGDYLIIFKS